MGHGPGAEGACPAELNLDWREYDGNCYWFSTFRTSWVEARKACQTEYPGADLAAIHHLEENSFISETFSGKDAWIGLNDRDHEDQFSWCNGDPVDFLYWARGQPDDLWFDQDCAHIDYDSSTGQWDDEDCDDEKHFVCKVASVAA
ncbi:Lectin BRA-3 [Amphibalanus amphitrite]|uniref:Lectin BRA-3 n=1 Tax=Amphibalanus amphitrite TaxID=1232801 RepID=A0A6A4XA00_AMPAM|nr:Lectin BRA-3 [Amphibalanus amphitrite]